jgi:hypothetical protein
MTRRFAVFICLALLAATLGGCTKCGWIWNDWTNNPHSCHSDAPR